MTNTAAWLAAIAVVLTFAGSASAQGTRDASAVMQQLDSTARSALASAAPVTRGLTRQQAATVHAIGVSLARDQDVAAVMPQWQALVASAGTSDIDALAAAVVAAAAQQAHDDLQAAVGTPRSGIQTLGEDAQLANMDMQNALQRSNQAMNMLSSVMKPLHDSAAAVRRSVR